ncbi:MAG: conjugal transfer protein TraG N-terminal domain-containing protein, partial [Gammaproteobacteria bacterium]|nr:conjugal transfer protein TraG N-terminal domain-containing protein [Gammaproteobacteria bacterium]
YGYTSAMQKQLLADNTLARVASYMMPLSQTVFVLITFAIFPIIVLLSLQPALFAKTLKNYIGSLVYLATWPILFCIINFIMTTELSYHMTSIAQLQGGITLSNQNQLVYEAEQFAAYCGYLIALVPVIAGFIFRGLDAVFMNAAQALMGNMQGWTSQTATALADGNVSLANSSIGNHSWNNWSANKHDTNYTNFSGMRTNQLDNGATVMSTPTGSAIYNTSAATSQLATSINAGAMISSQLSQSLDHSQQVAKQESQNYTHSINQSWNDLSSFSDTHGLTATQGHNYSVSSQTSSTQAVSNIMGIAHDVAARNHISEHEAYQHLQGYGFNTSVDAGGSIGFPVGAVGASAGGKVSASANYSHSNSYGTSADSGSTINVSSNEQEQFSKNYNLIKNASDTEHTDQSHSHNLSGMSQLSSDFRQTDSVASQLSSTLSDTNRYSDMLSYAESNSSSIQNNFSQAFAKHVEKEYPQESSQILSNTSSVEIAEKRQALAESFIKNNYMNQFEKSFESQKNASSPSQQYASESAPITNKSDRVVTNFMEQKNGLYEYGSRQGVNGSIDASNIQGDVNANLSNTVSVISNESSNVEHSNENLNNTIDTTVTTDKHFIKNKR